MKPKILTFAFLLFAFIWSCTPDDTVQIALEETENFSFMTDPQLEQESQQLLEQAKNGLNASPHQRGGASVVLLPAGSVDALQSAVRAANGGIVYIRAGEHRETKTVTIDRKVTILAEKGAVLIFNTQPSPPAIPVQPALHVLNAPDTYISDVEIRAEGTSGGIGILVQNSPRTKILKSKLTNHQFGIVLEKSEATVVYFNTVVTTSLWQSGALENAHGIININGERVRIISNDVSNSVFGIWACDKDGYLSSNYVHGNFLGIILCKVPEQSIPLPDGTLIGATFSATNWLTTNNNAVGNFDVGYLIIDGANGNTLTNNFSSNNARVDYEVVGDSQRFGFFTPQAFNNTIQIRGKQTVKDCGLNSKITGGVRIDTQAMPCF